MLPFLELLSGLLAAQMQRPAQELRLPLQSAIFLVSRYAISANDEVVSLVASGATNEEGAYQAVEDHLVESIMGMLRIGDARTGDARSGEVHAGTTRAGDTRATAEARTGETGAK